jgi:hypothetical protein
MKRLMFARLMDEAASPTGEGSGGGTTPAPTAEPTPAPETPADNGGDEPADKAADPDNADVKPFLGKTDEAEQKPEPTNLEDGEKQGEDAKAKDGEADKPKPPEEKDYLDAIKKDDKILGDVKDLQFEPRLIKSVVPVMQKFGISTEAANAMANAFAKEQLAMGREALKERADRFAKMNADARNKYTDADFKQINAGIDRCFKPGGVMNMVVRNSELGADPEFLALMYRLGEAEKTDSGKGAASGGGSGTYDPTSIAGLAKDWK